VIGLESRAGRLAVALLLALAFLPASTSAQAPSAAELARGKYVFGATGGCGCHTVPKQPVNAGGRRYDGPFGTVYSSNITPDRETGIGGWTDEQIITATRLGRRPNGERLIPVHPYTVFNGMAADDLKALVAFLRSVPAVKRIPAPTAPSPPPRPILPATASPHIRRAARPRPGPAMPPPLRALLRSPRRFKSATSTAKSTSTAPTRRPRPSAPCSAARSSPSPVTLPATPVSA